MNFGRYKFSLEAPLRVKEIKKNRLEKELVESLEEMETIKANLKALEAKERKLSKKMKFFMVEGTEAQKLKELDRYLYFLGNKTRVEQDNYLNAKGKYERLQGDMIILLNELNILHDLKKEKYKKYIMELGKHEEKILEDNIIYRTRIQGGMGYD